jgi:hypothetical protein
VIKAAAVILLLVFVVFRAFYNSFNFGGVFIFTL